MDPAITRDNFFFNGTKGFYCGKDTRTTGIWECVKRKCLSKAKGRPKPPLMPDTVDRLRQFFEEHNKNFYALVGKDFGWPPRSSPEEEVSVAKGNTGSSGGEGEGLQSQATAAAAGEDDTAAPPPPT